jgi:hypothetical protein
MLEIEFSARGPHVAAVDRGPDFISSPIKIFMLLDLTI